MSEGLFRRLENWLILRATLVREINTARAENRRLRDVIRKAAHDLDLAEFGEGYGFNLPFIVRDLRSAGRDALKRKTS